MANAPTALISGIRSLGAVGGAMGDLQLKTAAALRGVAAELEQHQLQMSEVQQLVSILRQLAGIELISGYIDPVVTATIEYGSGATTDQDIVSGSATV